ncbi:MAG: trigger factor [Streptosporangiaceae bacterium]
MKTDVEELSPTRVKLTVEVPFDELKQNLDHAYRDVARQVRIPGFRPGRVPPRIIDQRVGRGAVLEQAIQEAVPELYSKALEEHEVYALGQPDLEITRIDDGKEMAFTAEVDVRPSFDLPDLDGLAVTVDDSVVTPDQVEEYLGTLRERFASLKGVDRPVADGDFVSIDLAASVDGKLVEDAQASGISYEVGTDSMLAGLDEALTGLSAGETTTFTAELAGGRLAGATADVQVTVHSVKVRELPVLDDEFAQSASEFDTIGELRAGTREQLAVMRQSGQVGQARERVLDAVLELVDIPLPERVVDAEIRQRRASLNDRLERAGMTLADFLQGGDKTEADLEEQFDTETRRSMTAGFILDKVAVEEELAVESPELNSYVTQQAYRLGVTPDQLAQRISDSGQIPTMVAELLRTKALTLITERATVTDAAGNPVDVAAITRGDSVDADHDGEAAEASEAVQASEAVEVSEASEAGEAERDDSA